MLLLSPRKVAAVAAAAAGKQNCCEPHSNLKSKSREKKCNGKQKFRSRNEAGSRSQSCALMNCCKKGKEGGSHVAARLETSQFKRLRSRPLAVTERDCKTLRMRNIYAFIFVSARNQIYIFGPLKLIIILPHTKTAFTDKGGQQVGVRKRERERYEYEMRCSFWLWLWLCGSAAALSPLNVLVISFGQHPSAHTHTHTHCKTHFMGHRVQSSEREGQASRQTESREQKKPGQKLIMATAEAPEGQSGRGPARGSECGRQTKQLSSKSY